MKQYSTTQKIRTNYPTRDVYALTLQHGQSILHSCRRWRSLNATRNLSVRSLRELVLFCTDARYVTDKESLYSCDARGSERTTQRRRDNSNSMDTLKSVTSVLREWGKVALVYQKVLFTLRREPSHQTPSNTSSNNLGHATRARYV